MSRHVELWWQILNTYKMLCKLFFEFFCITYRHGRWNQRSEIRNHENKAQTSTGLMSIPCISWPNNVFFSFLFLSVVVSQQLFDRDSLTSLLGTVDVKNVTTSRTVCGIYLSSNLSFCGHVIPEVYGSDELILNNRDNSQKIPQMNPDEIPL